MSISRLRFFIRPLLPTVLVVTFACASGDGLPPGQRLATADDFPVFSFAGTREIDTSEWSLHLYGLVDNDTTLSWDDVAMLPYTERLLDFHCVTGWSRLGDLWGGIPCAVLAELAAPDSSVTAVMVHCADGYTTNLTLDDFTTDGVILALEFQGEPLTQDHGYPARLIVPHLYAYKSAKWVVAIEFLAEEQPGYWEEIGYHHRGDPWQEERYAD